MGGLFSGLRQLWAGVEVPALLPEPYCWLLPGFRFGLGGGRSKSTVPGSLSAFAKNFWAWLLIWTAVFVPTCSAARTAQHAKGSEYGKARLLEKTKDPFRRKHTFNGSPITMIHLQAF